jgi:uncharacterized protein (TIGR01244 family)
MKLVKLTDNIAVSAQITPEDVAAIAAAGYKVLINNRPDGEEAAQPSAAEIAASAQVEGLEYHHMPVTARSFPGPDFDAMSDLLDDPGRPVLAFCRTGTRCTNLWLAGLDQSKREAAIEAARQKGFDLGMATKFFGPNA